MIEWINGILQKIFSGKELNVDDEKMIALAVVNGIIIFVSAIAIWQAVKSSERMKSYLDVSGLNEEDIRQLQRHITYIREQKEHDSQQKGFV